MCLQRQNTQCAQLIATDTSRRFVTFPIDQVETLREKIISLELSNAEDDVESITGTGASDGESESEDTAGQTTATEAAVKEKTTDSQDATEATDDVTASVKTAKTDVMPTKKKKRKRSKKGRH